MKIIYVSTGITKWDEYPNPNLGGQVQIWGFAKEIAKRGHDVTILKADNNEGNNEVIDRVNLLGLKTTYKDEILYGIPSQLLFSKKSVKKIKNEEPDILNSRFRFSGYFPSKLDIPKIFTVASPDALDYIKPYAVRHNILNYPLFHFNKMIETRVMSNSDEIIVLNKFMEDYLKNESYTDKIKMVPNGIDPTDFSNKGDDKFILYAGRFDWNKRVDVLIKAFSMLDENYKKDFKLKIVGQGYNEKYLKNLVKSRNIVKRVEFVPWIERSKLINFMSRCSLFVLPSLFETFGIVVIEAMASGKPVIASDTPGPQDVITHGYNGFLFEKGSVEELKNYLELCLSNEDLRKKVGMNARKTIEEKYTFEKVADRYIDLFKELVEER